jgi:hypothetical protein
MLTLLQSCCSSWALRRLSQRNSSHSYSNIDQAISWINLNIRLSQKRETRHKRKKSIVLKNETDGPWYDYEYPSILKLLIEDGPQILAVPVWLNMDQRGVIEINQKLLCRLSNRYRCIFSDSLRVFFVSCELRWQGQQYVFGRIKHDNSQYQCKVNIDALNWIYHSDEEIETENAWALINPLERWRFIPFR